MDGADAGVLGEAEGGQEKVTAMMAGIVKRSPESSAFTALILGFVLGFATEALPHAEADDLQDFRSSDSKARVLFLGDLVSRRQLPPTELEAVLREGIMDSDPKVRAQALSSLAARALGAPYRNGGDINRVWTMERPALLRLKGTVWRAMDDPDEGVRSAALIAAGSLEYETRPRRDRAPLSDPLLMRLFERFLSEPSPRVRGEIINVVALRPGNSLIRKKLIQEAFSDTSPGVLQYALRGAGDLKMDGWEGHIASFLTHADRSVRLSAVMALFPYGDRARPYIDALKAARATETEDSIAKTLDALLKKLVQ